MYSDVFINWLLEAETASIRYLTLRNLLNRPAADPEVNTAWEKMKTEGPIPAILAGQSEAGSWIGEHSYYTPKYTSTHWSLLLLAELGADSTNSGFIKGVEFMLKDTETTLSGRLREKTHGLTCFWANLLGYALHSDIRENEQVQLIEKTLVFDALQADWRCPYNDERPCAWGAARTLWAMASIPERQRITEVRETIQSGLSFLLEEYNLLKANYPTPEKGKIHPLWFKLNYPLFYQADILFVLRVLAELGTLNHPGAQPALNWLIELRQGNKHWRGSSPFRRRTYSAMGEREETARWVSLHAAMILKSAS